MKSYKVNLVASTVMTIFFSALLLLSIYTMIIFEPCKYRTPDEAIMFLVVFMLFYGFALTLSVIGIKRSNIAKREFYANK